MARPAVIIARGLARAAGDACELACLGLFVGAVLTWAIILGG